MMSGVSHMLVAVLVCLHVRPTAAQPSLQVLPSGSIRGAVGEDLSFTCSVTGVVSGNTFDLRWYDSAGDEIRTHSSSLRLYVDAPASNVQKLFIQQVREADAGRYTCRGDVDGTKEERVVTLVVFKDITFDEHPSPQFAAIYTAATIICRVSGQPAPEVFWRYRGRRLVIGPGTRYTQQQRGLTIQNVTRADDGMYQCSAEVPQEGRFKKKDITFNVHIPPVVTSALKDARGIHGQEGSITCTATGLPPPKFEFYKGNNDFMVENTPNSQDQFRDRIQVDRDAGVINFRPLDKGDKGTYRCVAINDVGSDERSGVLEVIVPPLIYEYDDVRGDENAPLTLVCLSEGEPAPTMHFYKVETKESIRIGEHDNGRIKVVTPSSGRLEARFSSLHADDMANYTCIGMNDAGDNKRNATVFVNFRPRFPPGQVDHVYMWAGKTRNLTCQTRAEPEPDIQWFMKEEPTHRLYNNETYHIYPMKLDSHLQVTVIEGYQGWVYVTYLCRAVNNMGSNDRTIQLRRASLPGPPTAVTVKDNSPTIVSLTVAPPTETGGIPLYGYRVEYDGDTIEEVRPERPQDGATIQMIDLNPDTPYLFGVRSITEMGVSDLLMHTHKTLAVREPYPAVIISETQGGEATEYKLSWQRPRTGGISIKEYRFQYRRLATRGEAVLEPGDWITLQRFDDPDTPRLYYMLQGLRPGSSYQAQVFVRNDIGWSLPNSEFIFNTKEGESFAFLNGCPGVHGGQTFTTIYLVTYSIIAIFVTMSW